MENLGKWIASDFAWACSLMVQAALSLGKFINTATLCMARLEGLLEIGGTHHTASKQANVFYVIDNNNNNNNHNNKSTRFNMVFRVTIVTLFAKGLT